MPTSTKFEFYFKDFNEDIIKVEVKWLFDRIYVLTRNFNNVVKFYEIDTNYKLIALMHAFDYDGSVDEIFLSSNPVNG